MQRCFLKWGLNYFGRLSSRAAGQIAWRNAPLRRTFHRSEAYLRMRRGISYVNPGRFRVKTEAEKQIWNEGSRLIANAIIYNFTTSYFARRHNSRR